MGVASSNSPAPDIHIYVFQKRKNTEKQRLFQVFHNQWCEPSGPDKAT